MATNVPPHNLREICNAAIRVIQEPKTTLSELMTIVPGPDFPTGGFIYGERGILEAYSTGRGVLKLRGRAAVEHEEKTEKQRIVIREIPYQQNKARLIEKIADLVKEKRIEGISDVRDESDRDGMRIVIELKRDAVPEVVLNQLYKLTPLQSSFGVIMLAIVANQPRVLSLREMLDEFVQHRRDVVTRRCVFELRKAEERAHILEGLKIALENIDEVIALIKASKGTPEAKQALIDRFGFSEVQAQAILDMRLQRLTGLERDKLLEEYAALLKEIARLKQILADERLLLNLIVEELTDIRDRFGEDRRTEIVPDLGEISIEDLIAEEEMVVTVSHTGYIKRNPISLYRAQKRGGKGKTGMGTKTEDFVEDLFVASTHSYVLVFTDRGKVYWLKVHEIPQAGRAARGKALVNLVKLEDDEKVAAILPVKTFEEGRFVIMTTSRGVVKKTDLMAYSNPRSTGIIATLIDEGDALVSVKITDGSQQVFLGTRKGKSIRFKESQVRAMGRATRGVKGIELEEGDEVVDMVVLRSGDEITILAACERGYGKRTSISEYPVQSRGGKGVITIKTTTRNGDVVGFRQVNDDDDLMFITREGIILRTRAEGISVISRNTQGVRLIHLDETDQLISLARLVEGDHDEDEDYGEEDGEDGEGGEA